MKFFTDKTVINDYLLIKIVDYNRLKEKKGFFNCRKNNRQEFFEEYQKLINKGIKKYR